MNKTDDFAYNLMSGAYLAKTDEVANRDVGLCKDILGKHWFEAHAIGFCMTTKNVQQSIITCTQMMVLNPKILTAFKAHLLGYNILIDKLIGTLHIRAVKDGVVSNEIKIDKSIADDSLLNVFYDLNESITKNRLDFEELAVMRLCGNPDLEDRLRSAKMNIVSKMLSVKAEEMESDPDNLQVAFLKVNKKYFLNQYLFPNEKPTEHMTKFERGLIARIRQTIMFIDAMEVDAE